LPTAHGAKHCVMRVPITWSPTSSDYHYRSWNLSSAFPAGEEHNGCD